MITPAARLLREARQRAGLSQAELARRAGTSQPALSAYERGHKDPSAGTLTRLLAVTGTALTATPGPATTRAFLRQRGTLPSTFRPDRLGDVAHRVAAGEDLWFALREFLDGVGLVAAVLGSEEVASLITAAPRATGDRRADAAVGAVAEHLAARHGVARPAWTCEPHRFLDRWWFPHSRRAFDAMAIRDAPAAFRRRSIMVCPSMLERV